jgi:predicted metal-dependent phosphotriesterase family hydrolase
MSEVATVRGPVDVADLGPTYMHEHIFVLTADGGNLAHPVRSSLLSIFPVGPFGRSATIRTSRGYL